MSMKALANFIFLLHTSQSLQHCINLVDAGLSRRQFEIIHDMHRDDPIVATSSYDNIAQAHSCLSIYTDTDSLAKVADLLAITLNPGESVVKVFSKGNNDLIYCHR